MSTSTLADTLQRLAEDANSRSETSRLRAVLPDVEKALAAGVRRQTILDALHQDGFTMNMKTFEKALYRLRKRGKRVTPNAAANPLSKATDTSTHSDAAPVDVDAQNTKPPLARAGLRKIRDNMNNLDLAALVAGKGLVQRD